MPLRMSESQARKHMQKKKPDVFITLRREQFEELQRVLMDAIRIGPLTGTPFCDFCKNYAEDTGALRHEKDCPIDLISKLEKV